jgi:hypothetical protein
MDSHCNDVVKAGSIEWFPRRMPRIRGELNSDRLVNRRGLFVSCIQTIAAPAIGIKQQRITLGILTEY